MKILKTLSVGVGGRGRWPLEFCRPENGFELVGLCDVNTDLLVTAAAQVGMPGERCFTELATALDQTKPDCVVIVTPTKFHVPMSKLAIERGVAVLVEKGMAPDWASANDLVRTVTAARVPVCVAQNYRYNAMEQTVRRAIADRDWPYYVGEVFHVDYIHHRVRPVPRTLNYPFASVWDMSCHHFDTLINWLGPVQRMTGEIYGMPGSAYPHPNNTSAVLQMRSGARVSYVHTHDAAHMEIIINVHGTRGCLRVRDGAIVFHDRPLENFGSRPPQDVKPVDAPGQLGVLRDFHCYVTEGVEPGISARQNLEVMAMCQMFVLSVSEHRPVERTEMEGRL